MSTSLSVADLIDMSQAPWQEQLKHRIRDPRALPPGTFSSPEELEAAVQACELFPMAITPYYASLMNLEDPNCPVRKQAVPSPRELAIGSADMRDPLAEEDDSPIPGLTHRYPDRVLLLASNECAMYCRHCTRKRSVGDADQGCDRRTLQQGIDYIRDTPQIRDVLVSGGDPLLLSDQRLEWLLTRLREIPHVEIIRIGTRTPVVLPQRITPELLAMLRRFQPLWINTHFNHPREFTEASEAALAALANAGFPLGNQSVLLRDVNDCPLIMRELVHRLVRNRVRPYYLYQCDLSRGIEHFRTPVAKGIEIIEMLRGHTSGFAVPTFVVDAPAGGGKVPLQPNYLVSMGTRKVILRNFEGVVCVYQEPRNKETNCPDTCHICDESMSKGERWATDIGVGKLFNESEGTRALVPEGLERAERREDETSPQPETVEP